MSIHQMPGVDTPFDPLESEPEYIFAYYLDADDSHLWADYLDHPTIDSVNVALQDALVPLDEPSIHDQTFGCDCGSVAALDHTQGCSLSRHDAWRSTHAEWYPELDAYIYIGMDKLAKAKHPELMHPDDGFAGPPSGTLGTWTWTDPHKTNAGDGGDWGWGGAPGTVYTKCRHYDTPITLPDGTVVWPSSHKSRKKDDTHPDFGVYLCDIWQPDRYPHLMVPWTDFGLPRVAVSMFDYAAGQVLALARDGLTVEFGCMGGHGRTGTFLACLLLRAGIDDPIAAIAWTREHYCHHAIEGDDQEWWVKRYHAFMHNLAVPPAPVKTVPTTWTSTAVSKLTIIGTCPACKTKLTGNTKTHTEGYCCANEKCKPLYSIPISSPKGEDHLKKYPSLKTSHSK